MMNNELDYEDIEIIEYSRATNKILNKRGLLLDDNDPRIILEEGANIYE